MLRCFGDVYRGKKVLVTGHTGFKGSWLTLFLKELGAQVCGYSLEPPTKPCLFEAARVETGIRHIIGDVRNLEKLLSIFEDFRPDFVFHLASQPLVRVAYREPRLTYETNVMGVVNLFEAVRATDSIKVVVNVTSDKCYENRGLKNGYKEEDPMGGADPYSSAKGCAELVTSAYRRSFFNTPVPGKDVVVISSARAGNVIGGGDWAEDRLLPDCVRALSKGRTILLRNPYAVRPWHYVLDAVSGYLWLGAMMYLKGSSYGSAWNFGPQDDDIITVEEVTKSVIYYWGYGEYSVDTSSHPYEASLLRLDCGKARDRLLWAPAYDINTALDETVQWYKEFYRGDSGYIRELTIKQIERYVRKAIEKRICWSLSEKHEAAGI